MWISGGTALFRPHQLVTGTRPDADCWTLMKLYSFTDLGDPSSNISLGQSAADRAVSTRHLRLHQCQFRAMFPNCKVIAVNLARPSALIFTRITVADSSSLFCCPLSFGEHQ